MGLRVFKLNSLYSSQVVEVTRILVVRNIQWEVSFYNKLSSLFVQVLREVGTEDYVCDGGLANHVLSETGCFEGLKHNLSNLWE